MEIKILSQEDGMAKVGVTLPGVDVTKAIDGVYKKHQKDENFSIPRKGLEENPEAGTLLREAVQELFSGIYQDVMRQVDLPVASEPSGGAESQRAGRRGVYPDLCAPSEDAAGAL